MLLRSGTWVSVHVCCTGSNTIPFFRERKSLSPEEKKSIPKPAGALIGRCDHVINLSDVIDHFAFWVLKTEPDGVREWIMRGFGRWLTWHLSSWNYSLMDINSGNRCLVFHEALREGSLRCAIERLIEEHVGEGHYDLVMHNWDPFFRCYCRGMVGDEYMEIGNRDFSTTCYYCYAKKMVGRSLVDRNTFLSCAERITTALVMEGRVRIQQVEKRECTIKEMCDMASKVGESLRGSITVPPHCHFLQAARVAWNELTGLEKHDDHGWRIVRQHFVGDYEERQSDDSEATVTHPMPT